MSKLLLLVVVVVVVVLSLVLLFFYGKRDVSTGAEKTYTYNNYKKTVTTTWSHWDDSWRYIGYD